MTEAPKKQRPPNPRCGNCKHPLSFHPRDPVKHRRKCGAFGCHCKNFQKESE